MKTKLTNWDVMKNDFYKKVRDCKDELQEVLTAAQNLNYCDFDLWYASEHDYRFLKDILGERAKKGLPFDYLSLIHLPKINGATVKGDLNITDYGCMSTDQLIGDATISVTQVSDPDREDTESTVLQLSSTTEIGTGDVPTGAETASYITFGGTTYALPGASSTAADKTWVNQQIDANMMKPSDIMFEGASEPKGFTIGETQYNFPSGTPEAYLKSASIQDNSLVLTNQDDKNISFAHQSIKTLNENDLTGEGNVTLDDLDVYNKDAVDQKIATGTGLYLGWLQNNTEEITEETEKNIGTWIVENWSKLQPETVATVTNNDYIYIAFPAVETGVYWRVKVVTEATGKVEPTADMWKKDLEFTSDMTALIAQVETNTKSIAALDSTKVDKISGQSKIYCTSATGEQANVPYTVLATPGTIATRTDSGTLNIATPTEDNNATTKAYVDEQITTEATRVNSKYTISTTAPTAIIEDGGIHIIVLDSEPTTKYDGYIYMIKE